MMLRTKIHLYSAVLFAILLLVMNVSVYLTFSKLTLTSRLDRVEAETLKIAAGIRESAGSVATADLLRAYVPLEGMLRIVTPGGTDKLLATSSSEKSLNSEQAVYNENKRIETIKLEGRSYALVSVPVIWTDGEVVNIQVTESIEEAMNQLLVLRIVLVTVTVLAMIPAIISSLVLGRLITLPITRMTQTMKAIMSSGKFIRIEQNKNDKNELAEMGQTFNRMIDLLESNFEKQEQFVSNASHELKTPLTVIESYSSLLKRKGLERPELFTESIDAIHSEAVRMKEMTEQLLMLARRKEQWTLAMETLELVPLAEDSAKAFRRAYGRDIQVDVLQETAAYADSNKLRQLLFILLDNARKYSDEGIRLTIGIQDDRSFIRVADRGIGIPRAQLEKVFDRFYRVDEARVRQSEGGAGLGLSLAKEIADAIGARIELDSVEGTGTTATIWLNTRGS